MQRASFKCETPRLKLKSLRTFLAIKRCERTKIGKVIKQSRSSKLRWAHICAHSRIPVKVEELTSLLIWRGYIDQPRSMFWRQDYHRRAEILVMSALFTLGNGALFCSLRGQTNISISECLKFLSVSLTRWWI